MQIKISEFYCIFVDFPDILALKVFSADIYFIEHIPIK